MNIYHKLSLIMCLFTTIAGCANCSATDIGPNIRQQPGSECCQAYCTKVTDLKCVGYYEDMQIDVSDGGKETMSCVSFCQYELKNSIPLNPCCIKDTLNKCEDIENICK